MPQYRRPQITDVPIYFTVALAQRPSDALLRHVDLLRAAVRQTRAERPFDILAWVVLPDHMHCIWSLPEGDRDYPTRWRLIKSRVSRALPMGPRRASDLRRNERGFWQRRYWEHHLRDPQDLAAHLQQCWRDPVRHGLVARPEDWPWSSVHQAMAQGSYRPAPAA
ncbi:transposase [Pseudorhodobacter sp. MZDSW-24AT]|uniref:REP-associated tyrosine transposase n=1 Tax=Pseudorhodobacter sp. MZDSW-24AT TaxID=2052957 RepID=UPI000C1E088D|nr:transposase [Pseudorhodobacter sp. MZDSW-24AT]PJF08948.1 transposase [Pseudorhodobacter sp. MZDSW-24AT]